MVSLRSVFQSLTCEGKNKLQYNDVQYLIGLKFRDENLNDWGSLVVGIEEESHKKHTCLSLYREKN